MLLAGCPGQAPSGPVGDDAPDVDAGTDAPLPDPGQRLSGKTLDYFSPATAMDAVELQSDGIDPPMVTTSATGGLYALEGVPTGSKVYFTATRPNYRPTRNAAVTIEGMEVIQDLYLMSLVEVTRQYTTTGNTPVPNTAFVAAEIKRNNGMPFEGLPIDGPTPAFSLVDALDAPVPGVKFYGFGVTDLIPDDINVVQNTTAAGGKVRIGILDVPPGQHTLKVSYLDDQGQPKTITAPIVTTANGATIAVAGGEGGGGGGGGNGNQPITNPTFGAHVYPMLQKAADGGLGCANCHTAGGTAGGVLQYDLGATQTLAAIQARPGVLVLTPGEEATSLFLTKPLYEPAPVNHPNATFLDINDNAYKLWLLWITQGALP